MSRSFTIVNAISSSGGANIGGRFISKTPAGAASKAASRICRETAIRGICSLEIHVQETTRGSAGKVYMYRVSRRLNPKEVERDGKIIEYRYEMVVKSVKI